MVIEAPGILRGKRPVPRSCTQKKITGCFSCCATEEACHRARMRNSWGSGQASALGQGGAGLMQRIRIMMTGSHQREPVGNVGVKW